LEEAWQLQRAGEFARAKELYVEILRSDRKNFDALFMLGFLSGQMGQFAEAEGFLGDALRLNSTADAYFLRGYALQRLNRHEEALASFELAFALTPKLPKLSFARGLSYSNLGRHEEAPQLTIVRSCWNLRTLSPGIIVRARSLSSSERRRLSKAAREH